MTKHLHDELVRTDSVAPAVFTVEVSPAAVVTSLVLASLLPTAYGDTKIPYQMKLTFLLYVPSLSCLVTTFHISSTFPQLFES